MTDTAPELPAPTAAEALAIGFTIADVNGDKAQTFVVMTIQTALITMNLSIPLDSAEQMAEQLPAALAGAVAAGRRHRLGLVIPGDPRRN